MAALAVHPDAKVGKRPRLTPLGRSALRAPLEDVAAAVKALRDADKPSPKRVHALRVACRRAEAAILALRPALDDELASRVRRKLRRLRRAAGPARDLDVSAPLLSGLGGRWAEDTRRLAGERKTAFAAVRDEARGFRLKRFRAVADALAESATTGRGALFTPARESGWAIAAAVHAARAAVPASGTDTAALHRLRVRLKRLRYTIDLFGPGLRPALPPALVTDLRTLLDALGAMTDAAALLARTEPGTPTSAVAARTFAQARDAAHAAWEHAHRADLLGVIERAIQPAAPRAAGSNAVAAARAGSPAHAASAVKASAVN